MPVCMPHYVGVSPLIAWLGAAFCSQGVISLPSVLLLPPSTAPPAPKLQTAICLSWYPHAVAQPSPSAGLEEPGSSWSLPCT